MSKLDRDSLLWKIYENLIRTEERLKALADANTIDHNDIRKELITTYSKQEELGKRIEKLEHRDIQLSTTWKIIIMILGAIPTILTILNILGAI